MNPLDRKDLAIRIRTVSERLREKQAEQLAHWVDAQRALGRAELAAAKGDIAEARFALGLAADVELMLLGDDAETRRAVEALDDGGCGVNAAERAADLAAQIRTAREIMQDLVVQDTRAWTDAFLHLGEAHQAALEGDVERARERLVDARAQERRIRENRGAYAVADHMLQEVAGHG